MPTPRTLAHWLALVDRLVEQGFADALDEHGVTRLQWRILGVIAEGAASSVELEAALADMPPAGGDETPAEELDELMASGWVQANDGLLTLTERGLAAYNGLADAVTELRQRLVAGIGDEEQARTAATFEQMARNLGWND